MPALNCLDCGACCRYVVIPIENISDDEIRWLEMHPGLKVRAGRLYISIACSNLQADNKCAIYSTRPQICRDFKVGGLECVKSRMLYQIGSAVKPQANNESEKTDLQADDQK